MKTQLFTLNQTTPQAFLSPWLMRLTLILLLLIHFSSVALGQTKQWDKTIGGDNDETLSVIVATADGGYLLGGTSDSNKSGDKTETFRGGPDYWIVKLNADGSKAWDKTIGGDNEDRLASLQQTSDGGYILGGTSYSEKSGDKSESNNGCNEDECRYTDYWIVKLNNDDNPCNQEVSSFTLLYADTEEELMALQQGDTVDLTILPTQNLSIRANTAPAAVGRVVFNLDSTTEAIDTTGPYTSTSKIRFTNGPHTLTATPYCEAEDGGGKGTALTLSFQVVSNERIVTITADKDNTLYSTTPEENHGLEALRTGRTGASGGDRLQRALLHFDLSSIPPGSRIDSAILALYVFRTGRAATGVALHKVTSEWNELASTWNHAISPGTPWTTPGGDFEPVATASTGNVSGGSLVIPNLTGDVQG